jgi:hypothetical protein
MRSLLDQYIKALERRVAELESCLAVNGIPGPGNDHWDGLQSYQISISNVAERLSSNGAASGAISPGEVGAVSEEDDQEFGSQEDVESMNTVLRDLSLDANGGYLGASSHVTMGRLFGPLANGRQRSAVELAPRNGTIQSSMSSPSTTEAQDPEEITLVDVPASVADRLILGYGKHIATRWPVVHSAWIQELHARRSTLSDMYEKTMLHLVYASGGRFLETTGETGSFYPKRHYAAALHHIEEILNYHDLRSVCALMLMAVYCLRSPVGPGAWTYSRLAMLIAVDLGLHRQTRSMKKGGLGAEMRKRIFWACYAFDRQISIPLGRPFSISDRDIDVPLPLDIDEAATDSELLRFPPTSNKASTVPTTSTSLSSWIHILKLRQIESDIQQKVYRVDKTADIIDVKIDVYLQRLEEWKAMIPLDAMTKVDSDTDPYDGYDYYVRCLSKFFIWKFFLPYTEGFSSVQFKTTLVVSKLSLRLHISFAVLQILMYSN